MATAVVGHARVLHAGPVAVDGDVLALADAARLDAEA